MADLGFVAAVERESIAFAEAARSSGGLGRSVPSCPGWMLEDLVVHLGGVQLFWAATVAAGGARLDIDDPKPDGRDPLEWYDDSWTHLVKTLRAAWPDAPSWAWWADAATVADVARRQAHEAAVHRWDAQAAAGGPEPLPAALAEDGVDEFFERMVSWRDGGWQGPAGLLALVASDTGRAWTVRLGERPALLPDGGPGGEATAGASVHASASDLDLLLWRRRDLTAPGVRVDGHAPLASAFLRWTNLD